MVAVSLEKVDTLDVRRVTPLEVNPKTLFLPSSLAGSDSEGFRPGLRAPGRASGSGGRLAATLSPGMRRGSSKPSTTRS